MNLIKVNSFYPLNDFNEVMKVLCNDVKGKYTKPGYRNGFLPANVIQNDTEFKIELAAPGLSKNDFNIELNTDNLEISVNREAEKKSRFFRLSNEIDKKKISARYDKGILEVKLPKLIKKNESNFRAIEVS
jgi:HSP20 family protein